jgi:hypothetical protein
MYVMCMCMYAWHVCVVYVCSYVYYYFCLSLVLGGSTTYFGRIVSVMTFFFLGGHQRN